ncbi:MAG: GNAT family N-acetyltransferase [Ferruginibacter sp.]
MTNITIRPIASTDNPLLATIIRNALLEHGAAKPGTVYYDASTDHLFELFQQPNSACFVATENDEILGCAGIFPTEALPNDTCELVKMYLSPHARCKGIGHQLMLTCIEKAKALGYKQLYLETLPELQQAIKLYRQHEFNEIQHPLGNSGHGGCNLWMIKSI